MTNKRVKFFHDHEDGSCEEITVEFPAKNVVCYDCQGNGTTYLGWAAKDQPAFTHQDFYEEGPDFFQDYMSGHYDSTCPGCNGNKVVLEIVEEWIPENKKKLWESYQQHLEDEYNYQRTVDAERRMGA